MAIPKFFHPVDLFEVGSIVTLDESEARHASQARRQSVGDQVMLLNGKGIKAIGNFVELSKRIARVQIADVIDENSNTNDKKTDIFVASSIPKGDRQKVMIDILTQLGIAGFIPLKCEFSVSNANAKLIEKWNKVAVEACKQSENPFLPTIYPTVSLSGLVCSEHWQNRKIFRAEQHSHANDGQASIDPKKHDQKQKQQHANKVLILIGPEGGFSATEVNLLDSKGVHLINVGQHILRTEAAAIAVVSKLV